MPTHTWTAKDAAGHSASVTASYTVSSTRAPLVVGMNSIDAWATRLAEVGPAGITARRWYATGSKNQRANITKTVADGMIPVVSYTLGVLTSGHAAYIAAEADFLGGLGVPVYVAVNHEPYQDMTAAQYLASQRALAPVLAAKPNIRVGPILHGWLLDSAAHRSADFVPWLAADLFGDGTYDFAGIDSYQTGSDASPGPVGPGDRVAPLKAVLAGIGHPGVPILIGEWNAWRADSLATAQVFLDDPQVTVACLWNNTGGVGKVLDGDRLAWFRTFKADARVQK
jgi:hypothetical protein